jgi:acetyltransferase-like isoleucine patch superfamily enzyme
MPEAMRGAYQGLRASVLLSAPMPMTGPDRMKRELRELHDELAEEMRARFHRDLPFDDLLFDRWERARQLGFSEGVSIYQSSHVYGDVKIGQHTWIGPFTLLDGSGGLEIGAWCSIAAGVQIYSHETVAWALSGGTASPVRTPTRIGDRCYIGPLSIIARGVTVGSGSVVAAHSFVNGDVAPGTAVGGSPARLLGSVRLADDGTYSIVRD